MQTIQALLADWDMGTLLLNRLTVQETGRLSGACRTARALERRALGLHAQERQATFLPMWNTDHVLARLERYRQPFFASGGLQFREMTALARLLLTELLPAGVIELLFELVAARNGLPPSVLGCHELRVLDPTRFVQRLRDWAMLDGSEKQRLRDWAMLDGPCFSDEICDLVMRQSRRRHPGSYMLDLLRDLGLKPYALFAPAVLPAELRDCAQLCSRTWVLA